MRTIRTLVFGIILGVLYVLPWALISMKFHYGMGLATVVGMLLGGLGMGVAIYIDAKRPEKLLGE